MHHHMKMTEGATQPPQVEQHENKACTCLGLLWQYRTILQSQQFVLFQCRYRAGTTHYHSGIKGTDSLGRLTSLDFFCRSHDCLAWMPSQCIFNSFTHEIKQKHESICLFSVCSSRIPTKNSCWIIPTGCILWAPLLQQQTDMCITLNDWWLIF